MAAEVLRLPAPARGPVRLYASYVYRFCPGAGRTSAKREDALGVTPCPAAVERQACKTADAAGMRIGPDVFPAASRAAAAEKKAYMRAGDACGLRPAAAPCGRCRCRLRRQRCIPAALLPRPRPEGTKKAPPGLRRCAWGRKRIIWGPSAAAAAAFRRFREWRTSRKDRKEGSPYR